VWYLHLWDLAGMVCGDTWVVGNFTGSNGALGGFVLPGGSHWHCA